MSKTTFTILPSVNAKLGAYRLLTASPPRNVLHPASRSTAAVGALSSGMWEREHRAVVCYCEYVRPSSASRCRVAISIRPPYGDQAAQPVSS